MLSQGQESRLVQGGRERRRREGNGIFHHCDANDPCRRDLALQVFQGGNPNNLRSDGASVLHWGPDVMDLSSNQKVVLSDHLEVLLVQ